MITFIKILQKTASKELLICDSENPKRFKLTEVGIQLSEFSANKNATR